MLSEISIRNHGKSGRVGGGGKSGNWGVCTAGKSGRVGKLGSRGKEGRIGSFKFQISSGGKSRLNKISSNLKVTSGSGISTQAWISERLKTISGQEGNWIIGGVGIREKNIFAIEKLDR